MSNKKIVFVKDKYEAERDKYQWILTEFKEYINKKGQLAIKEELSYHSTLKQMCTVILDRTAGECSSIEELINHYETAPTKWLSELENEDRI